MAQNIDLKKFIPARERNEVNEALISNLFNRFVSQEDSLQVEGRIGSPVEGETTIVQPSLERQENAIIPGLYFTAGKEKFVSTFKDFLNRMNVLGIDVSNLREWIAEQSYNYAPPINYDKFINYANYYWTAEPIDDVAPSWNPNNSPEYYVIERPRPNDLLKMPVRLATTRNINLQLNDRGTEVFTVTFASSTSISVSSDIDGNVYTNDTTISADAGVRTKVTVKTTDSSTTAPALSAPDLDDYNVIEFYIIPGTIPFSAGDQIKITVTHFTSSIFIEVISPSLIGKGTASGVATITPFMYIDGVQVELGDRILVKDQDDPSENGIYTVVRGGPWIRTLDATEDESFTAGTGVSDATNVYILEGDTQEGLTSYLVSKTGGDLVFSTPADLGPMPVNEWQIYNYWVHKDDLHQYEALGVTINNVTQANRPIIEYSRQLTLNSAIDGEGNPTDADADNAVSCPQVKTRFNQLPQFDLYRYDGTHAGVTSAIWYYNESPNYEIDSVLLRRVEKTINDDFVFGCAVADPQGRLLFHKDGGELKTIWAPGVTAPTNSTPVFTGEFATSEGTITFNSISSTADVQQWTITFTSSTTANVVGSRSGNVGEATVGSAFSCDDFNITIGAGSTAYMPGDVFKFNIYAPVSPRYVKEDGSGNIINYPGGYAADQALPVPVGTWLTPGRMFQNMYRETRDTVDLGDFINHGRSVLKWQDGFIGSSFGVNNSRNIDFNPGVGGQIREFGNNFPLLASMLTEADISPLTIISFAEQQYNVALSSIDQFVLSELPAYISENGVVHSSSIDYDNSTIQSLEEYFEELRGEDVNLSQIYSDSTAGVTNWPASLPMMGLMEKVEPDVMLDHEMNVYVIKHHDGHISPLATANADFNRKLVGTVVERSDGTSVGGFISNSTPVKPYARQLWLNPSTNVVQAFDVTYDTEATPSTGQAGQYWYKRSTNSLYEWDAGTLTWVPSSSSVASRWVTFYPENIRNSLTLAIENKLYENVHPAQHLNIDLEDRIEDNDAATPYVELELASFAAKYGYDSFSPDYVAENPFTWNYSQATFQSDVEALIPTGTNRARWYSIYEAYFGSLPGAFATSRPDLEPWKLGTASFAPSETKPDGWDAAYKSDVAATENIVNVRAVATSEIPLLMGTLTVDGVALQSGDRLLLIAQSSPENNGIWVITPTAWTRANDEVEGLTVNVTDGQTQTGSQWTLTTTGAFTPGIDALEFKQARTWLPQMWADILDFRPGLRLCVNTATDALLPPYVSSTSSYASLALTNTIPAGISLGYEFGDLGPIELVWKKSIEYKFGLARTFFKLYPLEFLDKSWGETYIKSGNNLRLERNLMASLPASKFKLHGERLNIVNTYTSDEIQKRIITPQEDSIDWGNSFDGTVEFRVTHVANTGDTAYDTDFDTYNLSSTVTSGNLGDSSTVFSVLVNGTFVGYVLEGVPFSFTRGSGETAVTFTDVTIDDLGVAFEYGDTITIAFTKSEVTINPEPEDTDFVYGELGCEGCVADSAPDPEDVTTIEEQPLEYSFTPGQAKIFKGVGQWFTNLMRYSHIDEDVSTAILAYRGWEVKLVHRLGSLIRPDLLTVRGPAGLIPSTGYNVILKRSSNTRSLWITALRVQLVQMGARKLNARGLYVPSGDASDWIFRVEGYNIGHPQVDYNVLDTDGSFTTFKALNSEHTDIAWKRYTEVTGTATTTMPIQITGLQNTLNFIFGYVSQLEENGFKINATNTPQTDASTGRNIDWQLEIEKFVNNVYAGMQAGSGVILNPFMDKLFLDTPNGLMGRFSDSKFLDVSSSQACYDVISSVIPLQNLSVLRTDPNTITYSSTPIFSAHVFVDEFEHVILFNERFSSDDSSSMIFDEFLGAYLNSAYVTYSRQNRIDGKPTMDGFFLNDDNVIRNPTSTIDALNSSYDPSKTFSEPTMAEHALALIGFKSKSYFDDIGINKQTQLDFWRGMINAKGTNLTVSAFTNYKAFLDSSVDEFWAYKLATYGDARERTFPEVKIGPNDCSRQFTGIQFYSSSDESYSALPLFIQVEAFDDTRWKTIDDLGTVLRFDAQKISETVVATAAGYYELENTYHTGDTFNPTVHVGTEDGAVAATSAAKIVSANVLKVITPGTYVVVGYTWINRTKLSPVKLFDYSTNTLVDQISLWHPAIGVHTPEALEIVNISSPTDPAHYNYTVATTNNPAYLALKPWDEKEVGRVWWDTSKLDYIPYHDAYVFPNREARHSRWGSLAEYASIDLYQWTESDYHPSEYNEQAAAQEGDSTIDQSVRLSGEVGFTNYYKAERTVAIRPIAWSQTSSSNGNAHPAFGPATFTKVYNANDRLIADTGRLAPINLVNGYHFGSWDLDNNKPTGEVVIGTDVTYHIGNEEFTGDGDPILNPVGDVTAMSIVPMENTSVFGTRIGKIELINATPTEPILITPAVPYSWEVGETFDYSGNAPELWNENVELIGGSGTGAIATIYAHSPQPFVEITSFGSGYEVGDILSGFIPHYHWHYNTDESNTGFNPYIAGVGYAPGIYELSLTGGSGTGALAQIVVNEYGGGAHISKIISYGSDYEVGDILSADVPTLPFSAVTIVGGKGYEDGIYTNIALTGGSGTGATADISVANGSVLYVTVRDAGSGYSDGDVLTASLPQAPYVFSTSIFAGGRGYIDGSYYLELTGGSGSGATAGITVDGGKVTSVFVNQPGSGYDIGDIVSANIPTTPFERMPSEFYGGVGYTDGIYHSVPFTNIAGSGSGAEASITVLGGVVVRVVVTDFGSGYADGDILSVNGATQLGGVGGSGFRMIVRTAGGFEMPVIYEDAGGFEMLVKVSNGGFKFAITEVSDGLTFSTKVTSVTPAAPAEYQAGTYKLRMKDSTGYFQDVELSDWVVGDKLFIPFETFGVQVVAEKNSSDAIAAADLVTALSDPSNDIFIREAVSYETIVDLGDVVYSNNPSDNMDGWKVWQVPTQSQLNSDLTFPRNKWLPYIGDSTNVDVTADVVEAMNDESNTWTLRSGVEVNRYTSSWSDWMQLTDTVMTVIANGTTAPSFELENETEVDSNRLSVYVNGVQVAPASIVISDNVVSLVNTPLEGSKVHLLYRHYQPTEQELSFDPEIEDDFQVQTWYKVDYQYTQRSTRDVSGNVTGTKYYFWVKNKTVPQVGKSMSLEQAADLLRYGSPQYMIFSRLVDDSENENNESGVAYDSCAISGLGTIVTKTNAYKLRFLRNFTLRDDPEELKLKNVHTEWALIRQHMPSKVPSQLWTTLTNAVCGEDSVGNQLPSQTRINYDAKYNTNTRYGFESDQIFVDSDLALDSIINTILNTSLTLKLGAITLTDYITILNVNASTTEEQLRQQWFSTPQQSRATMSLIYSTARAAQINEIFFNVLNDALANNYEFTDLFKTSLVTVNSTTIVKEQTTREQANEFF